MIAAAALLLKVKALIGSVGTLATFDVEIGGSYDPADGSVASVAKVQKLAMVSPPVSYRSVYRGTDIKSATSVVYLPASGLSFTPRTGMKVTIMGQSRMIEVVTQHTFQSTVLLYELEVVDG